MTKTTFGYRHSFYGPDMDGCNELFEWIEDRPMKDDPQPDEPGWFAECEIEPGVGWLGPYKTEEEAIRAATTEEGFMEYQYGDDPMGDHHGRNI